jgi:crotonobetaine/carnitine-CoA ligase
MLALLSKRVPDATEQCERLRYVVAAPVPEDLHRPLEARWGVRIVEGYGLTETGTMACINPPHDTRSGTIGLPLEHNELRVVDEEGNDVGDDVPGQILTRSRIEGAFMSGYFKAPEATAEAMAGGWFHTGDIGRRRPDGYFVFVDRGKDTIRRRGENISSFLVEKAVLGHPEVAEVAAIGVPSELSEEDVKIVVVRTAGSTLTEAELASWSDAKLGDFMRPRYIEFRDELPRTETGRVQKYLLRRDGIGVGWDRGDSRARRA